MIKFIDDTIQETINKEARVHIKPCPFCGGEPKAINKSGKNAFCLIMCENYGMFHEIAIGGQTEKEVIELWNKRSPEE